MDCKFSEFSYGYAAIREAESVIGQIYRQHGAPVLPSLIQEEELGYDARIPFVDYALFLQFKRTEYVSRRHPASPTWEHVNMPHYRFTIDTAGHQHAALARLEARLNSTPGSGEVFYTAPTFHLQEDFDHAYGFGEVLERSSIVLPSELEQNVGVHHFVVTAEGESLVLSQPRPPQKQVHWSTLLSAANDRAGAARERVRHDSMNLESLEDALLDSLSLIRPRFDRDLSAPRSRRIQRLAAVLGCGLALFTFDAD
ncbi:hypothetical protein GCM10010435_32890 [Winogradskya consettensis]|uniref:Uncharacterized protein n=1 Tax=Winogradskya consettensis TaxID=113560 RepID=A0A919SE67_9ACTN|nr:hypothetical protein Aco04nite_18600 [Actinoplanes consettensis]